VLTTLSFVTLAISGIILFITPPGRIAHWTGWRFWGLTKTQWSSVHIWFALLFVVAGGAHIYYNWRPLLNYFQSRLTKKVSFRFEWIIALVVCLGAFVGTLAEIPPFSSFIAWDEEIKLSWVEPEEVAPIPHAELLSLAELATEASLELEVTLERLRKAGLNAQPDMKLRDIALKHNRKPYEILEIVKGN